MPVKELSLDAIRIDGGTQPRTELDMFVVAEYADQMQGGAAFPPVEAVFDGKHYWLWDGFHRYHGARKAEGTAIRANVEKGTVEDARWLALGANKAHGLRRTNEDKRRAVEEALRMRPKMSDRAIADHCGVDHVTVGRVRREQPATGENHQSSRTDRNGREMNTANIGKRRDESAPAPTTAQILFPDQPPEPVEASVAAEYIAPPSVDNEPTAQPSRLSLPVDAPSPPRQQKQAEYITLDQWEGMSKTARKDALRTEGHAKFNDQGDNKNIEWALWSWNPVTGCRHNCPYCYARDIANRFYEQKFEPSLVPSRLTAPQNTTIPAEKIAVLRADAEQESNPDTKRRLLANAMGLGNVFTCSMADLFGRWVPSEWIEAVLKSVRAAPQWNFLFLTKFPIRMAEFDFPENTWVGTTVDCQARVANAEKAFRKIKAGVKWLSIEPLIEPLKFTDLSAFHWIVIGGSSASSQTPEWHPPRPWITAIEHAAFCSGVEVYEKSNLKTEGGLPRYRGYPGLPVIEPSEAPEQLRYLATPEKAK